MNKKFPEPGYYILRSSDDENDKITRCYYLTGTTKDNLWFDTEDTEGAWSKLRWVAVPPLKELTEKYVFGGIHFWYDYSEELPKELPVWNNPD
jgi:hypothetical protein